MYRITGADGKEYGPVSAEQLRQWMSEGRVDGNTRVQAVDGGEWKVLSAYPELAPIGVGAPPPMSALPAQNVPNYLVQSILVTICCCLPLGIPAIIFAAQVNGKLASGDVTGAEESSRKAKMFCWWALGLGLVGNIIGALIGFFSAAARRELQ